MHLPGLFVLLFLQTIDQTRKDSIPQFFKSKNKLKTFSSKLTQNLQMFHIKFV
jgi:hypothetical protein